MEQDIEEDKKQINKMLNNIYDGLEFEDDEEIRELYLKQKHALKTALSYMENSIPKQEIKNDLKILQETKVDDKEKFWMKSGIEEYLKKILEEK